MNPSNEQIANDLKQSIIDVILASPLNIQALDDATERELYTNILNVVEQYVAQPSCMERISACLRGLCQQE